MSDESWLKSASPMVMGILNVTPDSFSDGGRYSDLSAALSQAERMIAQGADIIDIGGESTRPGAAPVSPKDEMQRVLPVLKAIKSHFPEQRVSIDTSNPQLMLEAAACGADLINDVRALQRPGALEAAQQSGLPVCLMHMLGEPTTMQASPRYDDVVSEVLSFLQLRISACEQAGIGRSRLLIDPGFGFGKTLEHNVTLMRELQVFEALGLPLLVGVSRKRMIGEILGKTVEDRLVGSVVLAAVATLRGARILRVHDVEETRQAVDMAYAVRRVNN